MLGRGYATRVTYDDLAACAVSLDFEHHETHEGHAFQADAVKSLTQGSTYIAVITTPDHPTLRAHIVFDVTSTGEYTFEFLEDVTGVVGGTAYAARNRKRESSVVSQCVLLDNVTSIAAGATVLEYHHKGATQGNKTTGGGSRGDKEWILKPNTVYAVRVTAIAAGIMSMEADWYEHKTQLI